MCEEWIKKNKIFVVIGILVIILIFLYKKEENYDASGYNFNIEREHKEKIEIKNSDIINSRLDNILITNAKCLGLDLTGEDIYAQSITSKNGLNVEDGDIKFSKKNGNISEDIFTILNNSDNQSLFINMNNRSEIKLLNKDSRIILGEQVLTEDTIRFINELKNKSTQ